MSIPLRKIDMSSFRKALDDLKEHMYQRRLPTHCSTPDTVQSIRINQGELLEDPTNIDAIFNSFVYKGAA